MRRVCVVITARPSYSRIKSALVALKARPDVDLSIVVAASAVVTRYGKVADQIEADGFEIAARVSSVVEDDTLANSALSTGLLLSQLAGAFERLRPDVVVTIADRHETLATAIAASYQHIPLCHVQGGEVTGSIDDKVRNAVTQLADLHLVATSQAAQRVTAALELSQDDWGWPADGLWRPVLVTGCPSIDLAAEALKLGPLGDPGIVVLQHPVTGEREQAGAQMQATIDALALRHATYFWPGENAGGQAMSKQLRLAGIKPIRSMAPVDFLRTLLAAECLVGNSSVGIRECSFLGVPVVNIGTRQQGRERGPNVLDVSHDPQAIQEAINRLEAQGVYVSSELYGDGHAGERIAGLLSGKAKEAAA
jgi:UDP-hydrolysing UDP-N-acetyl-D-glucosamine 2-epimerase